MNLLIRVASSLLGVLICLTLSACKPASDTNNTVGQPKRPPQKSAAGTPTEDALVQQATTSYRQRIQQAASVHAANAKRMQETKVLDMSGVTQREQLEPKREVVRAFLASNETLKSFLANEEAVFQEVLENLNVPEARIKAELKTFQGSVRAKAANLRMRETDQRIGNAMLGALDFLDGKWGQWNYSKDYNQVQFSLPGALGNYNEFMEAMEAASKEQSSTGNE